MPERAEIEALVPWIHWQGGMRGKHNCDFAVCQIEPCPRLRAILDRVRDARDDDEAVKYAEVPLGPEMVVTRDDMFDARSPQDEDHEAVLWRCPKCHRVVAGAAEQMFCYAHRETGPITCEAWVPLSRSRSRDAARLGVALALEVGELRAKLKRAEAARSPQSEDHGPEPDALGGLPPSQPKEDQ
jgi:hypothetical protein